MPGMDRDRLLDSCQIDDELICGICLAILIDPIFTPCCRQTYCGDCIREWLRTNNTCPNDRKSLSVNDLVETPRIVINMLNKLEFKCSFNCEQKLTLETIKRHEQTCKYNPNAKCVVCGEINGEIDSHNCIGNLLKNNISLKKTIQDLKESHDRYVEEANKLIDEFSANDKKKCEELSQKNAIIESNTVSLNKLNEIIEKLNSEKLGLTERTKSLSGCISKHSLHSNELKKYMQLFYETIEETAKHLVCENSNTSESNKIQSIKFTETYSIVNEAKFHTRIEKFNESLIEKQYFGKPVLLNGLKWNIKVFQSIDKESNLQYLSCHLICQNETTHSSEWSCKADVSVCLVKQQANCENKQVFKKVFNGKEYHNGSIGWGWKKYILWSQLLDQSNNYIKDDSIFFEITLKFSTH